MIAVVALVGIFIPMPKKNGQPKPTTAPSPTFPTIEDTETKIDKESPKIKISGVTINNFYQQATETKEDGFAKFVDEKDYQIMYIPVDNSFLISILGAPFEEIRNQAEKEFLKKLNITQEEACRLNVNITTPAYINPSFAGKVYKLSFCNKNE